ncbi:GNAT family N-acetyltransferase [Vibrio marisflavi]|uniref:N-acetyltransferase domain-containing protein n=1 Tax=Vibrio marisflavi CECT 7928 TaxID=634439 RepID=A0ABN8E1R9_9VIBR|nr:GNAT family N-acetyltransferase [Vibrio marisflavi]CAH0538966.1 hypothetical protein VMF7928_01796 [Vibrio marisflavi CECT 7928]
MEIRAIDLQQVLPIRHQVLWPNEPIEYCIVDGDETAEHFGAFLNNKLVCVASIYLDNTHARLRKFATLPAYQTQGIGSAMIQFIIHFLSNKQMTRFWCDARESALPFYQRFNMKEEGNRFYKNGVPYFKVSLNLV